MDTFVLDKAMSEGRELDPLLQRKEEKDIEGTETSSDDGDPPKDRKKLKFIGALCIVCYTILLPISYSSVQLLENSIQLPQLLLYRQALQLALTLPLVAWKREPVVSINNRRETLWIILTSFITNCSTFFLSFSAIFIPIGTLAAMFNTTMLWFMLPLTRIFFKESVTVVKICILVYCTEGILCVLQPSFLFSNNPQAFIENTSNTLPDILNSTADVSSSQSLVFSNISQKYIGKYDTTYWPFYGNALALASGTFECIFLVLVKKKVQEASIIKQSFWTGVLGLMMVLIMFAISQQAVFLSDIKSNLLITLYVVTSAFFKPLICFGINLAPPRIVASLFPLEIVFMFIAQYTVLKHVNPGHCNITEFMGALMILLAAVMTPST